VSELHGSSPLKLLTGFVLRRALVSGFTDRKPIDYRRSNALWDNYQGWGGAMYLVLGRVRHLVLGRVRVKETPLGWL
jgi:hypothetical protein